VSDLWSGIGIVLCLAGLSRVAAFYRKKAERTKRERDELATRNAELEARLARARTDAIDSVRQTGRDFHDGARLNIIEGRIRRTGCTWNEALDWLHRHTDMKLEGLHYEMKDKP